MLQLYENIKKRRIELGMTQADLAKKVGYTRSGICRIEAGETDLSESKIKMFADALLTTPSELMGWDEKEQFFLEPDVAQIVQSLLDRPEMKVLFSAAKDVNAEDIGMVISILERMKGEK